ncbi:thioredoxin domain-containing protein [Ischnura elegans]|uniref:thioredoxin domain-containing protein n=1 Tax=Ischnura elegans TaxID=197161 RepID=UPI001ED8BD01|nr:thioredoxin domain-containing protein [Ischnura elegans]
MRAIIFILLVAYCNSVYSSSLEAVSDDELTNLIRGEKYVIVLFTKKDCDACDNLENELIGLREELVDSLNAWVVKAVNSPLVRLYDPSKEPALVFFRHGVPLLYDGPANEDEILRTLGENKEPVVKELYDDNFEHLTQVATGATTGDWFVMFYSNDCVECQRLQARWEAVGARLKTRLNVARVDKQNRGGATARRFNVRQTPTFILFRLGNMYRYNLPKYDVSSLASFAVDWYKNARTERVPVPKSPFDDFVQMIADFLMDNPLVWQGGLAGFSMLILVLALSKFLKKPTKKKSSSAKKSK